MCRVFTFEDNSNNDFVYILNLSRPPVPVQFQYFLPAYSSSYPLTQTYPPSSVSTIRQYPGKNCSKVSVSFCYI